MTATVLSLRAARAVRAFRKPLPDHADWLVTLLERYDAQGVRR